jgi:hypothetical protein
MHETYLAVVVVVFGLAGGGFAVSERLETGSLAVFESTSPSFRLRLFSGLASETEHVLDV